MPSYREWWGLCPLSGYLDGLLELLDQQNVVEVILCHFLGPGLKKQVASCDG